ncbi:MAG: hypothetical protein VXZ39_14610, partial [Planctomycetota bacterium]|nr:hypothetical protein [Planctomycetota bacterium]
MSPKKPTKKARSKKPASRRSAANRSKKAASRKGSRGRAARGGEEELEELLIVPVRNMILFPGVVLPLMLGRERSVV